MDILGIAKIADECGIRGAPITLTWTRLNAFAEAVARATAEEEREACAKTCEDLWQEEATAAVNGNQSPKYHDCIECAYAIRERSNAK